MLADPVESIVAETSTPSTESTEFKWSVFLGLTLVAIVCVFFKSVFLAEPISRFDLITQLDVLFNPTLHGSGITVAQDPSACLQSIPREFLVQDQLKHFLLPLWNNLSGCGQPLLADPANTVFGPIDMIFSPTNQSIYNAGLIVKMLLGGVLSFLLFTRYGAKPWAASVVAIGFALCSRVLRGIELATDYELLPAIFLAFSLLTPNASLARIGSCSLVLALAYVSLHPEVFFVGVISASIIWFSNFYSAVKDKKRVLKRALRSFILFGVISVVIVSPFLISFFEYLKLAQSYKYHDASMQFIPIDQLVKYLCDPKVDGTLFPGWLVIFGAIASLAFNWKQKWSVLFVAIVWVLFSFRPLGLIPLLGKPPWSYLLPEYGLGCILLMISTMAALGLSRLVETTNKKKLLVGIPSAFALLALAYSAGANTKQLLLPALAVFGGMAIIYVSSRRTPSSENRGVVLAAETDTVDSDSAVPTDEAAVTTAVDPPAADPTAPDPTAASLVDSPVSDSTAAPATGPLTMDLSSTDEVAATTAKSADPTASDPPAAPAPTLANPTLTDRGADASKTQTDTFSNPPAATATKNFGLNELLVKSTILLPIINMAFMFAPARHELPASSHVPLPPPTEADLIYKLKSFDKDRVTACGDRLFQPETNLLFGISDLRTCSPLNNTRYLAYMQALGAKLGYCNIIQVPTELNQLLDMASVKHILSDEPPVDTRKQTAAETQSEMEAETTEGRIMPGLRVLSTKLSGAPGLASVDCKITLRAHKNLGTRYAFQVLLQTDAGEFLPGKAQLIRSDELLSEQPTHMSSYEFHVPLPLKRNFKQLLLRTIDTWTGSYLKADGSSFSLAGNDIIIAEKDRLNELFDVKASNNNRFSVEFESPTMHRIYSNSTALPSAYLVHNLILASNGNEALKKICEEEFDYQHCVVLETYGQRMNLDQLTNTQTAKDDIVETLRSDSLSKIFKYRSKQAAVFVLTDCYYPGWRAEVDGISTGIYRSNFLFQSIFVPAGTHEVKFFYAPPTLIGSIVISLITSLLCFVFTIQGMMRKRSLQLSLNKK